MFDLYCWIHSTYTIPRALSLHVGRDVAHPGVMTRCVSHVSRPRVTCHLLGQLGPRVPHHGEVVYPVEAPPVQHGRGGVQLQLQPGQLRGVETGCST